MAKRKWTGIITENLRAMGTKDGDPDDFIKGQKVTVWKKKRWDRDGTWDGKTYDYHYSDENGNGLVRHWRLMLEGQEE